MKSKESEVELFKKFAVIDRFARLHQHFAVLDQLGIIKTHPQLSELHEKIKKCNELVKLSDQYEHQFDAHKPGLYMPSAGSAHGQTLASFKRLTQFLANTQSNDMKPSRS